MSYTIQPRLDTAANWTSANSVLAQGEWGLELQAGVPGTWKAKVGDGVTAWNSLPYLIAGSSLANPMTTLGDTISGGGGGTPTRLAGPTAGAASVLTSTPSAGVAQAPVWQLLTALGMLMLAGGTMAGWLAPKVVPLTDAATIAVNAALGNDFYVTLGGNRTMGVPTNPVDGQKLTFEVTQDATGSRTLTWAGGAGGYAFGSGSAPTLSTAAGAADQVAFRYSARKGQWWFLGSDGGF